MLKIRSVFLIINIVIIIYGEGVGTIQLSGRTEYCRSKGGKFINPVLLQI
jgi:hypothetical protein